MSSTIFLAIGLMLVFEGLLPFIAPQAWRDTFTRMIKLKDGQLRFVGIISIIGGLFLILLAK